jgi:hypothetical protein
MRLRKTINKGLIMEIFYIIFKTADTASFLGTVGRPGGRFETAEKVQLLSS